MMTSLLRFVAAAACASAVIAHAPRMRARARAPVVAADARTQLTLFACNDTRAPLAFDWAFSGTADTAGAFKLTATGGCVTYDVPTTNLVMDACVPSAPSQAFLPRADGTVFHPQSQLCWDSGLAHGPV